jgi:hypothetical protein
MTLHLSTNARKLIIDGSDVVGWLRRLQIICGGARSRYSTLQIKPRSANDTHAPSPTMM